MTKKKQETGTGNIAVGGAATAYGVARAPILRSGSKDMSRMQSASAKKQGSRYQAELHQAMQRGKVKTDSPVHVLRTPSGRHINAGGTHRQIAREAMGKPSEYKVKDISHELHVTPAQKVRGKLRVAALAHGSKRAEAGKTTKPVGDKARIVNRVKAMGADATDAHIWSHPSAIEGPVKLGRKAGLISAGIMTGAGALSTGVGLHQRHEWKKKTVRKSRAMSDTELRQRRKVQGNIGRTTSTLGLGGLGMTGAALAARKSPGALKALQRVPKVGAKLGKTPEEASGKLKTAAINTGLVSGGIGGVGGFNQASIYSDEARRRKPVAKGLTDDVGCYGEEGVSKKDWQPSASKHDSERSRMKRSQAYEDVGGPVTGVLAAGAGYKGAKAGKLLRANRGVHANAKNLPNVMGAMVSRRAAAVSHGKTGLALGGAAAATGAATLGVRNRNRSKSWAPYAKQSAFGVTHEPVDLP
jgi:hypothetical protein